MSKLILGDCLQEMAKLESKSVDMILTDLPYGTTQNQWDYLIPLDKLWTLFERIIKDNGIIILTSQTPFDKILGCSNLKLLKYELIWKKSKSTGYLNARKMPLKEHENILIFYKNLPVYNPIMGVGKPYKNNHKPNDTGDCYGENKKDYSFDNKGTRFPKSIIEFESVNTNDQLHPTQKPVELFEYLIKTYTNEGKTVLDCCVGSGTTAVACIKQNRNYICIEKEEKYFKIMKERISKTTIPLFALNGVQ